MDEKLMNKKLMVGDIMDEKSGVEKPGVEISVHT